VNLQLFVNNLTAGFDDTTAISIPAKSLAVTYNTITNAGLWGLIFLAVLPLGVLIAAFIRWNRRRKL
jgi:ABC-2 type transport system permease protein